jgi:hypothetical protein
MSATERRHVPRTKLDKLAYIHIEPNNGGIVLNVSGDGLAFHSMAPVEKNGPVHFSLKEQNRRIDVCGELIWTDEIQKIGGLRFTTLTNEAREQVDSWISQPETAAEEQAGSTLGAAFLRVFPSLSVRRFVPRLDSYDRLAPLRTKLRLKMSGFSGGLATGLLISMLTSFTFVFSYAHRQQFGEYLIHLGERLTGKAEPELKSAPSQQAANIVPPPVKASIAPTLTSPLHAPTLVRPQAQVHETQNPQAVPSQQTLNAPAPSATKASIEKAPKSLASEQFVSKSQPPKSTQPPATSVVPHANMAPAAQRVPPPNTRDVAASSAPPSLAPPSSSIPAKLLVNPVNAPVPREPQGAVQAQSFASDPGLPLQMFFDLGKFKQQELAQDLSERVAHLGIRASVVNKGHLWMNSYQVLAGPYITLDEEKKIHSNLVSNGIKARPFERGSRGFAFRSGLTIGGSKLPVGDFTISWETYVAEAKVKFTQAGSVLATADGKWINHPQKFPHNEYVYQNLGNGSRPLLEVHFAGLDRALVFR